MEIHFWFFCSSYLLSLQCLHEHFLLCAPGDKHLHYMQQELADPDVMLPKCYPESYAFRTSQSADVPQTTRASLPVTEKNDIMNELDNNKFENNGFYHHQLPHLNDDTIKSNHLQQLETNNDVITVIDKTNVKWRSRELGKVMVERLQRINSQPDRTFQTSNEAAKTLSDVSCMLITLSTSYVFASFQLII